MSNPYVSRIQGLVETAEEGVNVSILPDKLAEIFDLFEKCIPITPSEVLLIDLNVKLAQLFSLNRLNVDGVIANYYGMIFMGSGQGKDYPLSFLDKHLMPIFEKKFREYALDYMASKTHEITQTAREKYKSENNAQYRQYIAEHRPRRLTPQISDATVEGFYDYRLGLQEAEFGGAFLKISEFGDYLGSAGGFNDNPRAKLLTEIIEVYEDGNSDPKMIKLEKDQTPIRNIPVNAIFNTSLSNFSDRDKERLLRYLNRGGARRFFVSYIDTSFTPPENYFEMLLDAETNITKFKKVIEPFDRILSNAQYSRVLTTEAKRLLAGYQDFNARRTSQSDGQRSVLSTLHRKAMKLAAIISMIERPHDSNVSDEDFDYAIVQCEVSYNSFMKFYRQEMSDDALKLYEFLREPRATMDIRKQRFVHRDKFKRWFDDTIEDVKHLAYTNGLRLEKVIDGRSSIYHVTADGGAGIEDYIVKEMQSVAAKVLTRKSQQSKITSK